MRYILSFFPLMCLTFSIFGQDTGKLPFNHGQRIPSSIESMADGFVNPDMIYAPFMFWFWDEPLQPEKMKNMAGRMIEQGINPGYVHPRRSMSQSPGLPDEEWLGNVWFESFDAVTRKAKEENAYVGYVDEYWWPSLQAHGRVLEADPSLKAWTLGTDIINVKGGSKVSLPESFFIVAAKLDETSAILSSSLNILGQGNSFSWTAPKKSDWRLFIFTKLPQNIVDYMDSRLSDEFIKIALEPYEKNMKHELGKTVVGNFVDNEGKYGHKLVWSDSLASRYSKKFKKDIRLWMPLMLDYDKEGLYAKVRWEWFDLVSDLYVENFNKVVEWHTERGMYCVANFWEESLPAQTLFVGDHMKMQRRYTMPGQDALHDGVLYVHDFKEAVSVGEFENRRVMSEMLGASQWFRFNPSLLKRALNCVTAWGISNTSPHGVFTNRDFSGNPWMPDWYTENPLFDYLHLWSDFARRASYINSFGHMSAEVILYSPLESVWVLTDSCHFDSRIEPVQHPWSYPERNEHAKKANMIDRAYAKAMNDLSKSRIDFLIADRHYIREMNSESGKLNHGKFSFTTLVLPPMIILETEVAQKILRFARQGGYVYSLGELPSGSVEIGANDANMQALMHELKQQPTFFSCNKEPLVVLASFTNHWKGWEYEMETDSYGLMPYIRKKSPGLISPFQFVKNDFAMLSQHRIIDGAHFFWLVNNTESAQNPSIRFPGFKGNVSIWDCESGNSRSVMVSENSNGIEADLYFDPLQAYWLVIDPAMRKTFEDTDISGKLNIKSEIKGPWSISYPNECQPELEALWKIPAELESGKEFKTELKEWTDLGFLDTRFTGFLDYAASFEADKTVDKIFIDLGTVHNMAEVWVNGKHAGKKLWAPYRFEIGEFLKQGENSVRIRVGNLVDNYYVNPIPSGLLGPVNIGTIKTGNLSNKLNINK